jgi:hypothetical protein
MEMIKPVEIQLRGDELLGDTVCFVASVFDVSTAEIDGVPHIRLLVSGRSGNPQVVYVVRDQQAIDYVKTLSTGTMAMVTGEIIEDPQSDGYAVLAEAMERPSHTGIVSENQEVDIESSEFEDDDEESDDEGDYSLNEDGAGVGADDSASDLDVTDRVIVRPSSVSSLGTIEGVSAFIEMEARGCYVKVFGEVRAAKLMHDVVVVAVCYDDRQRVVGKDTHHIVADNFDELEAFSLTTSLPVAAVSRIVLSIRKY